MLMVKIGFGWDDAERVKKMDTEAYEKLRLDFPDLGLPASDSRGSYITLEPGYFEMEEVEKLISYGLKPQVSKIRGLHYPHDLPAPAGSTTQITNVSCANHALFMVDEVDWLENACTQELQTRLDGGWRILAVCPSNDARRPDYILGRQRNEQQG